MSIRVNETNLGGTIQISRKLYLNAVVPCSVNGCSDIDIGSHVNVVNFNVFDKFEVKPKQTEKLVFSKSVEHDQHKGFLYPIIGSHISGIFL